ncbi:MAG: ATPase, T2SS/T4P/T4SS family, partial [Candidatus Omnitrophota bacterium]
MSGWKDKIGTLLVQNTMLTQDKLNEALKAQRESKESLPDILIRLGYVSRDNLLEVLSVDLGIPAIHLPKYKIGPEIVKLIAKKTAQVYCVMPVSKFGNTLTVAMADPTSIQALDDLRGMTGLEIRYLLASEKDIRETIAIYYDDKTAETPKNSVAGAPASKKPDSVEMGSEFSGDLRAAEAAKLIENEPVVMMTNAILTEALRLRSSDIFIEPEEASFRVRYRVDGMLEEGAHSTREMHLGVVSRIKVMSNLDIAEHRIPQDGRFKIAAEKGEVDFRVSVLPTFFGEKVVLRVLDKSQSVLDIDQLGFEPAPLEDLKTAAGHPYGMIIICGPTGSGKTTTLYSMMKLIDSPQKNLVTVEDPVEFQIDGFNQVCVRPEVKLTFAAALRSILRQDPNIIMVGEMRDSETGDIAVKAALTGHLVLSTLHSNTAPGAVTRLLNMGIEPFLLTSSLLLAGSQRLVRKVCQSCRQPYEPKSEQLIQLGVTESMLGGKKPVFYRAIGCEHCQMKGYFGRAVLIEVLLMTTMIKSMILKGARE